MREVVLNHQRRSLHRLGLLHQHVHLARLGATHGVDAAQKPAQSVGEVAGIGPWEVDRATTDFRPLKSANYCCLNRKNS